jgi:UDP-N-acetylmuramoylalanine--D-glutamate ligase
MYYLVVGLGATGWSCVRHLVAQGFPVQVTDTRLEPPFADQLRATWPEIPVQLGGFRRSDFCGAKAIVVSPGVALQTPEILSARALGIPVLGDIQLFLAQRRQPLIAITGTNGKSTVTSLLGKMLVHQGEQAVVAGNIGQPVLDVLDAQAPCYVLELSSFQLDSTDSLGADIACVLNISADHLDRYAHYRDYVSAKLRIYQAAKACVYNADDAATYPPQGSSAERVSFTLASPQAGQWGIIEHEQQRFLGTADTRLLPLDQLRIQGRQNWQNALAACAMAQLYGVEHAAMRSALVEFSGLPHRCQWVAEIDGVVWINDSKGTNVGATLAALDGLASISSGKIMLLLGGQGKGGDFSLLNADLARFGSVAFYYGEDADLIEHALVTPKHRVADLAAAVALAQQHAVAGDRVLFSPACASFDAYANFAARGEHFIQLVEKLK